MKTSLATFAVLLGLAWSSGLPPTATHVIRGKPQQVRLYGDPRHEPVIVSSGDGGWLHLAPHVAELLAARGFYVVGFDAKAYLDSFTDDGHTLHVNDVPADFATLLSRADGATGHKPILIGVSEGAGLSVLAAGADDIKSRIQGVIAIGLGDRNELGWKWTDSIIYLTKRVPDEPTFSAADVIHRLPPVPLALLWSAQDEYVAPEEVVLLADKARDPKKIWTVQASDHRFSNNLPEFDARLLDALQWIHANSQH